MSPASRSPLALVRRAIDPRVWGRWWARIVGHRAIHQDTTLTWRDRYPELFAAARDLLGGQGAHRILSFGCAAGEKVLSVREYFRKPTSSARRSTASSSPRAGGWP